MLSPGATKNEHTLGTQYKKRKMINNVHITRDAPSELLGTWPNIYITWSDFFVFINVYPLNIGDEKNKIVII